MPKLMGDEALLAFMEFFADRLDDCADEIELMKLAGLRNVRF